MLSANGSGGTRTGKRDRQFSDKEDGTDEPVPAPDGARPPTKKRPRTSKHSQRLLRSLPSTRDLFWQQLTSDHASAAIWDKNHHGLERLLPGNETVAMALNEIAADGERGFFYYLPSREYWKTPDKEPLLPVGRAPGAPGANYPTLIWQDFVWSPADKAEFYARSQRERYLRSSILLCPPSSMTPLYAIQYLDHARAPIYLTEKTSLVLFAAETSYYLASTTELEAVIGRWRQSKKWKPSGPEPERRLEQAPFLFDAEKRNSMDAQEKYAEMQKARHDNIKYVQEEIVQRCNVAAGKIQPTLLASQIRALIPRGSAPTHGMPLGTPAPGETMPAAAEPPSSRHHTRNTKGVEPSADEGGGHAMLGLSAAPTGKGQPRQGPGARFRSGKGSTGKNSTLASSSRKTGAHGFSSWGQDDEDDEEELKFRLSGEEDGDVMDGE